MTDQARTTGRGTVGPVNGQTVETDYQFVRGVSGGTGRLSVPGGVNPGLTAEKVLVLTLETGEAHEVIVTRHSMLEEFIEFRFA